MFPPSQSDREEFEEIIRSNGFYFEDFELIINEEQPIPSEHDALNGIIYIRRKSIGIMRQYNAGHENHWLAPVECDLRNGEFGNP